MKIGIFFFLLTILLSIGCRERSDFFVWHPPVSFWIPTDSLSVEISQRGQKEDRVEPHILVRYNRSYPFSNFYLLVRYYNPNNRLFKSDTIEYQFSDKHGNILGRSCCFGYEASAVLKEFSEETVSRIVLQHGMRSDSLEGIESVSVHFVRRASLADSD